MNREDKKLLLVGAIVIPIVLALLYLLIGSGFFDPVTQD